ncbi:MAG TPA: amidohydrolase family protein, partial [Tepidisphaeraceae bacterium]
FLTIHVAAAERVMDALPPTWHAGLVLMDQHCPAYLQNDERAIDDTRRLAEQFGNRYVVTDRFAVANSSRQRRAAAAIAGRLGLMTQTHLNEQVMEKRFVEDVLYPHSASYTHVYGDDGLLDTRAMVAHCVQMTPPEWRLLAEKRAVVAHCPTSNARLGSGVMDLDALIAHGIDYAVCTDVGASGTTSLLAEMANFLLVHRGRSRGATACEALYRTTLAPARVLGSDDRFGHFAVGKQLCFVELATSPVGATDAESVLQNALLPPTLLAQLPAAMTRPGGTTVAEILLHAAATNDILAQHEAGVRQVVGMPA